MAGAARSGCRTKDCAGSELTTVGFRAKVGKQVINVVQAVDRAGRLGQQEARPAKRMPGVRSALRAALGSDGPTDASERCHIKRLSMQFRDEFMVRAMPNCVGSLGPCVAVGEGEKRL